MSFSADIKKEILEQKLNKCCKLAFLSAIIRSIGSLVLTKTGVGLVIETDCETLITKCSSYLTNIFNIEYNISKMLGESFGGSKIIHTLTMNADNFGKISTTLDLTDGFMPSNHLPKKLLASDCCQKAYLKGLMSTVSSVSVPSVIDSDNNPETSTKSYYVELSLNSKSIIQELQEMLKARDLTFQYRETKTKSCIYIKDKEKISDFCAYLGASSGVLALQNIIMSRGARNNANRFKNCSEANMNKSIDAAFRQISAINYVLDNDILDSSQTELKVTAQLRLEYPDLALDDLAKKFDPIISKSCLNHRLRKLIQLSNK